MRGDGQADVVMIGGGAVGLACARAAALSGLDAVLLDDRERRASASAVAAGMLAPVGEASWGEGRLLALNRAAARLWPRFAAAVADESGHDVPYRPLDALHVALDRDEAAELRRRFDLQSAIDERVSWLRGSECRGLEAGLATTVSAGVVVPDEAEIDPRALLAALSVAADAAGVRCLARRGARVLVDDGAVRGVELEDGGVIATERVVVAAGAWSGELLDARLRPPVRPVKGEILRLRGDASAMPCERLIVGERVYVVPRESGEVVVGATVEERGFDDRVTAGGVHELLREAYRALPEIAELELVEARAGLRPGTPDNAPVLGPDERLEGLILATGMFRNGILLAPIAAEATLAALTGEPSPPEVGGLGPERFAPAAAGVEA